MLCYTISRNSETCQDDSIAALFMNLVVICCTKTVLIYAIAQMTIIDLVGCIPYGTRLHSKALGIIRRQLAAFQGIR
jgi:hypothetical protein